MVRDGFMLMIGETISHYKILEKVGQGGMGFVYRAEDTRLRRTVALKFLPRELTFDEEAKTRFIREAQAAGGLDHPNVCTIYEVDETTDGMCFIAMAYCGGGSLKQRIGRGLPEIGKAVEIAIEIAAGLKKAHESGLIHRDIKPANILFTTEGSARIADFGLAKLRGQTKLTKEKTTLGTIEYMSPEQTRGEEVDHRTDIWSLGCLLYEMLTGQTPFRGDYDQAVIYSILNTVPKPLTSRRSGMPGELERIVGTCLEKAPAQRYQTAADLITDLKHLQRTSGTSVPTGPARRLLSRSRAVRWTAGALLLVAAAASIVMVFRPSPSVVVEGRKSIAVLPFSNLTGNKEEEYFSDGMTDDILTQLYKVGDLKVISRTTMQQYKGTRKSIREIGSELGVGAVLEGSVRRSGDRLRIVAQLIDARTDDHLWAENYDRTMRDVFEVQSEIAQRIVNSLQAKLSLTEKGALAARTTTSAEAYNAYLQGRYFLDRRTRENVEKAISYFRQALRFDSTFARAWVGLSRAHSGQADGGYVPLDEGYRMARLEVDRALRLDPNLAEAYGRLGWIKMTYDWDWTGADVAFRRALELEPGNASVVQGAAVLAGSLGRFEEALSLGHRAIELDPLLNATRYNLGLYAYYAGRWEESETALRKVLSVNPQYPAAHVFLGCMYLVQSKPKQALAEIQNEPEPAWRMFGLPLAYHAMGMRRESDSTLVGFIREYQDESAYQIAEIYAFRGQADSTFRWLDRAYRQRDGGLSDMKGDPLLRNVMKDPRYAGIMKRMKLPI